MITDEGDAVQFLASTTTTAAFQNRPVQNPQVAEIIEYALKAETQTTAKNGAYSGMFEPLTISTVYDHYITLNIGMLQVLFLSGATGYPIEQHVDSAFPNRIPEMQFHPCSCSPVDATPALHVMWVQMTDASPTLNHIIPLMPQSK